MKNLLLTLLAVVCLAGCATTPFVSAPPPNPPSDQVVILTQSGCRWAGGGNYICNLTVKNIGATDVKNVRFKIALGGNNMGQYESVYKEIDYLPSKETMELTVGAYDGVANLLTPPLGLSGANLIVDSFEIIPPR